MSRRKRYVPACDFQVGEWVYFPVICANQTIRYKKGVVHSVHDADFARGRGNYVNLVVVRNDMHYPTHSNLLRKTKHEFR